MTKKKRKTAEDENSYHEARRLMRKYGRALLLVRNNSIEEHFPIKVRGSMYVQLP